MSSLFHACDENNLYLLPQLIAHPNIKNIINETSDVHGKRWTPLFAACASGNGEVVRQLLEVENIDVNKCEMMYGMTPLFMASMLGHDECVRFLLQHPSIKVNKTANQYHATPLFFAASIQ